MYTFPIILTGVLLNAVAQLCLKAGTQKIGAITMDNIMGLVWQIAFNPMIFAGLFCYVLSVGLWIVALSRVDVSYAYPMLSLGYVVNAIAAYYLFDEQLSPMRIAGIGVIILGVFLISRTA
jgi:drug/metabolite transporter (DMT)-like permease